MVSVVVWKKFISLSTWLVKKLGHNTMIQLRAIWLPVAQYHDQ